MKYYYEKPKEWIAAGSIYICDHILYNRCTLFKRGTFGLAVIQERYNKRTKVRWWSTIDPWLAGDIFMSDGFDKVFQELAGEADENGIYPTIPVRKLMWRLRMKPLRKESWESLIF